VLRKVTLALEITAILSVATSRMGHAALLASTASIPHASKIILAILALLLPAAILPSRRSAPRTTALADIANISMDLAILAPRPPIALMASLATPPPPFAKDSASAKHALPINVLMDCIALGLANLLLQADNRALLSHAILGSLASVENVPRIFRQGSELHV